MNIASIAIVGYGRFGRTLETILPSIFVDSHIIVAKRDLEKVSNADIIIPAVPIREFETAIKGIVPHLKKSAILMDICSVKEYPKKIMLQYVPDHIQILATHPMFGPGTLAKTNNSLKGLKIVIDPVRIDSLREEYIKNAFIDQGMEVICMSSEDHDVYAAQFHFSAQFIASVLKDVSIKKTPIDTASVAALHDFMEYFQTDSLSLLQDMYEYNSYCKRQLEHITSSVQKVVQSLTL